MPAIKQIQAEIIKEFNQLKDWESKYKCLIEKGKQLPAMKEVYRIDDNKVKGCQSDVWLFPEYRDNLIYFHSDSNSSIVKGLVALLMQIFDQQRPDDILKADLDFLAEIGLKKHLSPTRSNGLVAMIKQIKLYALAIKTKIETSTK